MKLTPSRFAALADAAVGDLLATHGFEPTSAEQVDGSWFRTYRSADRYVRVSASEAWRDEEAHCQAVIGEGSDSWPETDWNSVGLQSLAGGPSWRGYVLRAATRDGVAEALGAVREDLEQYAADFLGEEMSRFREVRAAQNERRPPYLIHQPDPRGRYTTTVDPQSAALKARYGRGESGGSLP